MPARIVVAHDDSSLVTEAVTALTAAGWETKGFTSSTKAIGALSEAHRIELLITGIKFPEGTPHGISLALMARTRRPGIRVLFIDDAALRKHAEGIGEILPLSISVPELVQKASELLSQDGNIDGP